MQTLFEKISVKGLSGKVLERVSTERETVSPNTINLALKDDRPADQRTPLRNFIVAVAEEILKEIQEEVEEKEAGVMMVA